MQTIRTTITLSKEKHKSLKREAMEKDISLNQLLVNRITGVADDSSIELKRRRKAFESIIKLRKNFNTKGINYRELIEDGRKY